LKPTNEKTAKSLLKGRLSDFVGLKPEKLGPTIYTQERAQLICEMIASGFTMEKVAKTMKMDTHTIYTWAYKNPEFSKMLCRARTQQSHTLMDRALFQLEEHLARDDAKNGRQAVEAYIKIAERIAPHKYGTRYSEVRSEIEHKMSEDERNLRILEILAKANPELFKEHVPEAIEITAEPARLLEDTPARSSKSSPSEAETITDCNWEVA
jgi:cytidylate kinase